MSNLKFVPWTPAGHPNHNGVDPFGTAELRLDTYTLLVRMDGHVKDINNGSPRDTALVRANEVVCDLENLAARARKIRDTL